VRIHFNKRKYSIKRKHSRDTQSSKTHSSKRDTERLNPLSSSPVLVEKKDKKKLCSLTDPLPPSSARRPLRAVVCQFVCSPGVGKRVVTSCAGETVVWRCEYERERERESERESVRACVRVQSHIVSPAHPHQERKTKQVGRSMQRVCFWKKN
jgi:hypothetical protein